MISNSFHYILELFRGFTLPVRLFACEMSWCILLVMVKKLYFISYHYSDSPLPTVGQFKDKNRFPMSSGVSERMSAAERASSASSAEQANEFAVRANGGVNGPVFYASIS